MSLYLGQYTIFFFKQEAGEHYLIPCKKFALRIIMVKMGAKTKLQLRILEFFNVFFHAFMYFEI